MKNIWQLTYDRWHITHNLWHVTGGVRYTFLRVGGEGVLNIFPQRINELVNQWMTEMFVIQARLHLLCCHSYSCQWMCTFKRSFLFPVFCHLFVVYKKLIICYPYLHIPLFKYSYSYVASYLLVWRTVCVSVYCM